jgi:hypothetical protein
MDGRWKGGDHYTLAGCWNAVRLLLHPAEGMPQLLLALRSGCLSALRARWPSGAQTAIGSSHVLTGWG